MQDFIKHVQKMHDFFTDKMELRFTSEKDIQMVEEKPLFKPMTAFSRAEHSMEIPKSRFISEKNLTHQDMLEFERVLKAGHHPHFPKLVSHLKRLEE